MRTHEMTTHEIAAELRKLASSIRTSMRGHVGTAARSDADLADLAADAIGLLHHERDTQKARIEALEALPAPHPGDKEER